MIDITSDLKELNISYDKINVVRQGENSDTFLITTSKKKLIAKKFKNLNFQTITNTYLNKKILNQLVDKKLFPKVVYQSEEKDFLIYEYVESIKSKLQIIDPKLILKRGYSIVYENSKNKIIKSIHEISNNEDVYVKMSDGSIKTQIKKIIKNEKK